MTEKRNTKRLFQKIKIAYTRCAILFLSAFLIFLLINIYCNSRNRLEPAWDNPLRLDVSLHFVDIQRYILNNPALAKDFYGEYNIEDITEIRSPPHVIAHPALGFTLPRFESKFYNIADEGIRLDSFITKKMAPDSLNGAVWVLGGSTTFGYGCPDNGTISHFLNQMDQDRYFNLGCMGYNQNNEILKLLSLLRKGYRPSKVIFLDGNNDLLTLNKLHFEPADLPFRHTLANAWFYQKIQEPSFIEALPVSKYMKNKKKNKQRIELPYTDIYNPASIYHTDPVEYLNQATNLPCSELPHLPRQAETYYLENEAFLKNLGEAFGFEVHIFFQPMGVLFDKHPLIKDFEAYKNAFECFEALTKTQAHIIELIEKKELTNFTDLSKAHDGFPNAYIDPAHYSSAFNHYLAGLILKEIKN